MGICSLKPDTRGWGAIFTQIRNKPMTGDRDDDIIDKLKQGKPECIHLSSSCWCSRTTGWPLRKPIRWAETSPDQRPSYSPRPKSSPPRYALRWRCGWSPWWSLVHRWVLGSGPSQTFRCTWMARWRPQLARTSTPCRPQKAANVNDFENDFFLLIHFSALIFLFT